MSCLKYCLSCAKPNMFTIHVPVFCMHCGKPLDATAASIPNTKLVKSIINKEGNEGITQDDEIDDNFDNSILASLDPAKLGCDPLEKPNRGVKMGEIVGTKAVAFVRPKAKKISKKKFIEQFQKEASNSKEIVDIDAGQD